MRWPRRRAVRWSVSGTPTDGTKYDVILASGVVYHEEAIEPLLKSLRALSVPSETLFFLGVDYRFDVSSAETSFPDGLPVVQSFFERLRKEWTVKELPQSLKASVKMYACRRPTADMLDALRELAQID